MALLKLMSEAELNQAHIQKLTAEAESIKIGIATEGERMRIQEINMQIGLQRERREGVLTSIRTMNDVYDRMISEQQQPQQNMEQAQLPMDMPQTMVQ